MRRRSRHTPNTSESTGKIGQELPSNQPAPLVPLYPDETPAPVEQARRPRPLRRIATDTRARAPANGSAHGGASPPGAATRPPGTPTRQEWNESADAGRFELETQPEMPPCRRRSPRRPTARPRPPRATWCWPSDCPAREKLPGSASRRHAPLQRPLAQHPLRRCRGAALSGLVFSTCALCSGRAHRAHALNYVDATNLSIHERRQWIKMSRALATRCRRVLRCAAGCLPGAQQQARPLGERGRDAQDGRKAQTPVFEEGFAKITVVRVKSAV